MALSQQVFVASFNTFHFRNCHIMSPTAVMTWAAAAVASWQPGHCSARCFPRTFCCTPHSEPFLFLLCFLTAQTSELILSTSAFYWLHPSDPQTSICFLFDILTDRPPTTFQPLCPIGFACRWWSTTRGKILHNRRPLNSIYTSRQHHSRPLSTSPLHGQSWHQDFNHNLPDPRSLLDREVFQTIQEKNGRLPEFKP